MGKTTSPLFSMGASGQLGKSLVYGTWKGIPYTRQYVKPSNPNTTAQQAHRAKMKAAVDAWHHMDATIKTGYNTLAPFMPKPMSGFNAGSKLLIAIQGAGGDVSHVDSDNTTVASEQIDVDVILLKTDDLDTPTLSDSYKVVYGQNARTLINEAVCSASSNTLTASLTGLTNGSKYYWRIYNSTVGEYVSGIQNNTPSA